MAANAKASTVARLPLSYTARIVSGGQRGQRIARGDRRADAPTRVQAHSLEGRMAANAKASTVARLPSS
jgi:hypothetical protein